MKKIVDLTLPIQEHWRWLCKLRPHHTFDDGFFFHQYMDYNLHGFTHVDAHLHYIPGAPSIEKVPLDIWYGEATVVDLSHLGENGAVTAAEMEKHAQHVKAGDIVLLRTDWPLKCDYTTREFWGKGPYTAADACHWLVNRKVKTVGYDYPPDDILRYEVLDSSHVGTSPDDFPTHDIFFKAGVFVIEYLCNLHLIKKQRFEFMALPLPIVGGDGSPARAIAFVD